MNKFHWSVLSPAKSLKDLWEKLLRALIKISPNKASIIDHHVSSDCIIVNIGINGCVKSAYFDLSNLMREEGFIKKLTLKFTKTYDTLMGQAFVVVRIKETPWTIPRGGLG